MKIVQKVNSRNTVLSNLKKEAIHASGGPLCPTKEKAFRGGTEYLGADAGLHFGVLQM